MELITRQSLANGIVKRWKKQYPNNAYGDDKLVIRNKLMALGSNPNPDDIDEVIGNKSWTRVPDCDECGATVDAVVEVGETPDYESSTANICKGCLFKALSLTGVNWDYTNE